VVTVNGVFSYKDLEAVQNAAKEAFKSGVKVNCLILAEEFSGWGKDGNWGDLTFMYENDPLIGKIAVVADENRQDEMLMFLGAGRRQAEVECFLPDEKDQAQSWLAEHGE
jgi:hypothetical protein